MINYRRKDGKQLTKILKPGERVIDGRFKDGVDKGRFGSNNIPLPIKPNFSISSIKSTPDDDLPKQIKRQKCIPGKNRGKTNFQ